MFPCSLRLGNGTYSPLDGATAPSWFDSIYPYTKSMAINICPDAPPTKSTDTNKPPTVNSASSYSYNGLLGTVTDYTFVSPNVPPVATIGGIPRPAEAMEFEDTGQTWQNSQPFPRNTGGQWKDPVHTGLVNNSLELHSTGMNMVFVDGHAKWIPASAVMVGTTYYTSSKSYGFPANFDKTVNSLFNPYKE